MKKILYIILIALLSVVAGLAKATPLSGSGTETAPYIIATTADWTEFCDNHATYKNSYIKMANFVTAATNKYFNDTFSGTFDGDGYTLTVNISGGRVAPFMQVSNGTIKNLRVAGSITGSANHTSGLISFCTSNTTCTIQNCIVSATITNNGNLGGFIGHGFASTTINITDCVFNGTLSYSGANNNTDKNTRPRKVGGFVSWEGDATSTYNMSRCLFDGTINCTAGFTPFIVKYASCNVSGSDAASCLYTVAKSSGFPSSYTVFDGTSAIGQTAEQIVTTMNNAGGNGWRVFKGKAEPTMRPLRTLGNIPDGWTVTANGDTITVTNGTAIITEGDTVLLFPPQAETNLVKSVTLVNEGLLNGQFSVSSTKKVQFSQGNLQAITSDEGTTWTWAFATNQWDYVGNNAANNSVNGNGKVSTNGPVDLFGWSTSSTYYGINNSINNGTYSGSFVNWGVPAISNGGGVANFGWSTPSRDEWVYVFNTRASGSTVNGVSNARYTHATINTDGTSVNGIILFPDGITIANSEATSWGTVNGGSSYGTKCTMAQWTALAVKGCVFLPSAGVREGSTVKNLGSDGAYWSSTNYNSERSYLANFYSNGVNLQAQYGRFHGYSVRLVKVPTVTTTPVRCGTDNYSWCFPMPAGNHVLRTYWKQDAGLAYAKSDTTVYLGFNFTGQELTNPHNIPVTYSIVPQTGTNSGNTINNAGVVTINGIGIDTVKAIFAGNDTLLPDTAMYIINSRALYTLTVASNGNGSIEVERVLSTTILNENFTPNSSNTTYSGNHITMKADYASSSTIFIRKYSNLVYNMYVTANDGQTLIDSIVVTTYSSNPSHINTDHGTIGNIAALGNAQNSVTIKDINATSVQFGCELYSTIQVRGVNVFYHNNVTEAISTITSNTTASYTLENNTMVKLTANADTDNHFVGWNDQNTNNPRYITVTSDTTIQGNFDRDFEGSGTEDDPYLIPSIEKWNILADRVEAGKTYEGKFFKQTADVGPVTKSVGIYDPDDIVNKPFSGTYDGQEHYLEVNYTPNNYYKRCAPFMSVDGATIKNLHTTGLISTATRFAAGLIGRPKTTNKTTNVINCRSSIEIRSTHNGDGTHGGFVGVTDAAMNFIGCVFDGKLVGANTTSNGGFIGWTHTDASVHFKDCIFAPELVSMSDNISCTFSRAKNDTSLHYTNCYYTQAYGTEQGKQMDSITAGEYITSLTFAGVDTVYTVSGITAYANNMGLKYGDKFYAGNGDVVELSLSHADRTADGFSFNSYSASNGGIINGTTLTMPDTSTVINANYDLLYMLTLASNDNTMGTVALDGMPAGVTTKDANAGEYYVVPGTTVTVTATVTATPTENFHLVNWTDENSNVMGTDAQITLTITGDTTVQGNFDRDFEGSGTEDDPYLIPSEEKWNLMATRVGAGNSYEGKYFRQTADINQTNLHHVGTGNHPFCGTYDGQGHSIRISSDWPFYYVNGATIKNLHITGNNHRQQFASGLIYRLNQSDKTTNIINCRSSVEIKSGDQHDFDGTHGGFVGVTKASINFIGCVFDGKFVGQYGPYCRSNGGFIGWTESHASVHFKDCIFAPELVSMGDSLSCTFSRARKDTSLHFTNCYYTQAYGKEQGKQMDSITAGEYITSLTFAGVDTVYTVSGITAYANNMGLKYGDKFYAGNGDVVELSLSHADRTADGFLFNTYSASNGGIINGTTLTMPDTSTVINANYNSTTPTSPGLTPEGELTTTGNRFVDEHGQIVGSPRINQYGEIIAGGGTPTSVSSITVSKGSSGLSSDKVFYYVPGESYRDAINNNPENKLTGGYGWFYWENGVDQATIYYKEPGKQKDMSIDGNQHFGPGQTITLDSVVDPTGHTYIFVDQY